MNIDSIIRRDIRRHCSEIGDIPDLIYCPGEECGWRGEIGECILAADRWDVQCPICAESLDISEPYSGPLDSTGEEDNGLGRRRV